MARKIGLLDSSQAIGDQPQTYVRKSVAHMLVRRLLAEWVTDNVTIRRLIVRAASQVPIPQAPIKTYIPEKMPPREVPGVFFRPPQSDTWLLQHRLVTFLPSAEGE